jgi:ferrochelatase
LSVDAEPRQRYWPEPKPTRLKAWPEPFKVGSVGVLLVNLGTPDEPTAPAIRRYLREFLSDPRVIEIPKLLWWPILNGPILLSRPRKLVHRYASIWMEGGSPLLVYTKRQADGIRQRLAAEGHQVEVEVAMRYGQPSIRQAIKTLHEKGCEHILTVPLYPQYASSTTGTVVDEVTRVASHMRNQPAMRFIKRFHVDPAYINPLAAQIERFWEKNGKPQKLVMSFHGLPVRCTEVGDPYCRDSYETARALANRLALTDEEFLVTFQSRFGPAAWLQPYTEPTLETLAKSGTTKIDVVCPGFVADCLETLEEVSIECKDTFMAAGGEQFRYIPCLNDDPAWLETLTGMVQTHLQGWATRPSDLSDT